MNRLLLTIAILAFGVICGIALRDCGKKPIFEDSANLKRIASLEQSLKQIKPYNIHDTLIRIQTAYRNRFNTVERWIFDSTWDNIRGLMQTFGDSSQGAGLQREVGRRLLSGRRDSAIILVYETSRQRDSAKIIILTTLDSIKSDRISNLSSKVEKMQQAADKRAKRSKIAHICSGVLLGALIFLK